MLEGMKRRRVYYRLQHHSSWLMDPFLGLLLLIVAAPLIVVDGSVSRFTFID
jgi:predicted ABC-type exoprotein transport system permease subunit